MSLLARLPNRASFNLTYSEVLELPYSLYERMAEQIQEWRDQEDNQAKS